MKRHTHKVQRTTNKAHGCTGVVCCVRVTDRAGIQHRDPWHDLPLELFEIMLCLVVTVIAFANLQAELFEQHP